MEKKDQDSEKEIDEILKQMRFGLDEPEDDKPSANGTVDDVIEADSPAASRATVDSSSFDNVLVEATDDDVQEQPSDELGKPDASDELEPILDDSQSATESEVGASDNDEDAASDDDAPEKSDDVADTSDDMPDDMSDVAEDAAADEAAQESFEPGQTEEAIESPEPDAAEEREEEIAAPTQKVPAAPDGVKDEAAVRRRAAPAPRNAEPAAAAGVAAGSLTKAAFVFNAIIALNALAILVLAASIYLSTPDEKSFDSLAAVLEESIQARRSDAAQQDDAAREETGRQKLEKAIEEARQLYNTGQYDSAFVQLEQLLAAAPEQPELLWMAAMSSFELEQFGEAATLFGRLVDSFPGDRNAYDAGLNLAICYQRLGHYPQAVKAFYKLLANSGAMTESRRQTLPVIYRHIADCYRLDATEETIDSR